MKRILSKSALRDPGSALRSLEYKEPIGELVEYLRWADEYMRSGPPIDPAFTADLSLVIATLADCLDPLARSSHFLAISRRSKGRPSGKQRLTPSELVAIFTVLREPKGAKRESAIRLAMDVSKLSRAKVFDALRRFREGKEDLEKALSYLSVDTHSPKRLVSQQDLEMAVREAARVQRKSLK